MRKNRNDFATLSDFLKKILKIFQRLCDFVRLLDFAKSPSAPSAKKNNKK